MKKIYFTRHGQTFWNVANKICGSTDIGLTETGHEQAEELGRKIKESGIHIDEIICSPLSRAFDTAKHISEITGIPMRAEQLLTEQNFGKYEGLPRNDEGFIDARTHFIDSYGGGESMLKAAHRIFTLLDKLKDDDRIYLLVAHNGIARIVRSYFEDMANDEFSNHKIKNCEVLEFEYK